MTLISYEGLFSWLCRDNVLPIMRTRIQWCWDQTDIWLLFEAMPSTVLLSSRCIYPTCTGNNSCRWFIVCLFVLVCFIVSVTDSLHCLRNNKGLKIFPLLYHDRQRISVTLGYKCIRKHTHLFINLPTKMMTDLSRVALMIRWKWKHRLNLDILSLYHVISSLVSRKWRYVMFYLIVGNIISWNRFDRQRLFFFWQVVVGLQTKPIELRIVPLFRNITFTKLTPWLWFCGAFLVFVRFLYKRLKN